MHRQKLCSVGVPPVRAASGSDLLSLRLKLRADPLCKGE
jgi:hypothetical protein